MTVLHDVTDGEDVADRIVEKLVSLFRRRIMELSTPGGISWSNFVRYIYPYLKYTPLENIDLKQMDWTIQNICKACDYLDIDMSVNVDLIKNKVRIDINTEEAIREAYNSLSSGREIEFEGKRVKINIEIEKE